MEARYWILLAWSQQHPALRDWRERSEGRDLEGATDIRVIKLGPGFVGWGAEDDTVCG